MKNAGNGHGVLMKGAQIHLFPQKERFRRDSSALGAQKLSSDGHFTQPVGKTADDDFTATPLMISSSTIVEKVKVAFSQPTHQGKLFIAKYADNGGKFLVYE